MAVESIFLFRRINTAIMFCSGLGFFYLFVKKRNHPAIQSRSVVITGFVTFSFPLFNLVSLFEQKVSGVSQCFLSCFYKDMVQCVGIGVFLYMAARLVFIYVLHKEKLHNMKRFYLQVKDSSNNYGTDQISRTGTEGIEMSSRTDTQSELNEDFSLFNVEIELKNVEQNYYQKRHLISGRFLTIGLTLHYIIFFLLTLIDYFTTPNREIGGECANETSKVVIRAILAVIQVLIMAYLVFKIRKINDLYKIKIEIYGIVIVLLIYNIINVSLNLAEDRVKQDIALYITAYFILFFVLVWPLYLTYKKFDQNILTKDGENEETFHRNLENILKDKRTLPYFIEFSKKDYSIENVSFYSAIQQLRKVKKNRKKKRISSKIISTFISTNGALTLNLESETRTKCLADYEQDRLGENCFDVALAEVFVLMAHSTYPQFLASENYQQMITEVNLEQQQVRFND
ncbi:regulator of g protein signaling [Anaeramoeba flamelloides]|uniref:Regulator of g protein signaling n=1 Tax=Anaeramoeba flamelloides TaxID=1746091 RepID=A0ABQ8XZI1_9EUKA|nr:regulator of g protein signaling [Anaeramoeba flamelloides]